MTRERILQDEQAAEESSGVAVLDKIIAKFSSESFKKELITTVVAIFLSLGVAALIIAAAGYDPGSAFAALGLGAILNLDEVLWAATPLCLTGLAVALAFRCGLFNIGAEGQLYIGSIVATAVGYMIALPIVVHQIACLAIGVLAGFLYGLLPGLLKAYRGAHEVVTTMMLSYSAVYLTQWLVSQGPMHNPGDWRSVSPFIFDTARLPKLFGSPFLNLGFLIAVACVVLVDIFINRTVMGYEMRAVGQNQDAAETAGINSKRNAAMALALSGGLAGLAGAQEIMGYYNRFYDGWSAGIGFDGITVAVFGRNNAWGVFGAALFWGALKAGGGYMQTNANVPVEIVKVIQGLVVLFVAAPRLIDWLANKGVEYAEWLRESRPSHAILNVTALAHSILGFFLAVLILRTSIFLAFIGFVLCFISLVASVFHYKRDRRRVATTALAGVLWFGLLVVGWSFSGIVLTSMTMGLVGIMLSYLLVRIRGQLRSGGESQ